MSKEAKIRELLKDALQWFRKDLQEIKTMNEPTFFTICNRWLPHIDQTLALLKKEPCSKCGGSGVVPEYDRVDIADALVPCPACKDDGSSVKPEETSEDFVKRMREKYGSHKYVGKLETYIDLMKALDRIEKLDDILCKKAEMGMKQMGFRKVGDCQQESNEEFVEKGRHMLREPTLTSYLSKWARQALDRIEDLMSGVFVIDLQAKIKELSSYIEKRQSTSEYDEGCANGQRTLQAKIDSYEKAIVNIMKILREEKNGKEPD